jgi:serine protease Do
MTRILKIAGMATAVLGLVALAVLAAPAARGQVRRTSPLGDLHTMISGGSAIGVSLRDVDRADMTREKLATEAGAAVTEVRSEGPAAKAGLKAGDIVVRFDGETVRSAKHLSRLVDETPDGREVEATVVRNGQQVTLKVTPQAAESPLTSLGPLRHQLHGLSLQVRPEPFVTVPELRGHELFPFRLESHSRARLGIGVQDLTGQLGAYFGATEGALVTSVDDGTPAKSAGLKAGDVITRINGQAVRNADDLLRRMTGLSGEVAIAIVRDRKEQTVTVRFEAPRVERTIMK